MPVVLGIDAAWTSTGSSGVALLNITRDDCKVVRVSDHYAQFTDEVFVPGIGGSLDATRLLTVAQKDAGAPVDLVAIDMPMSTVAITGSRAADREVARAFGSLRASPYTPTAARPGPYGKQISDAFQSAGFSLCTITNRPPAAALIEVFPLAALARMLRQRPTYKVSKTSKYWRGVVREERMERLLAVWAQIEAALRLRIKEIGLTTPTKAISFSSLKPLENKLDAVICAWVGMCYLAGRIEPFGDDTAAIWVPACGT
jgi:predicted RNase H-like nuclease